MKRSHGLLVALGIIFVGVGALLYGIKVYLPRYIEKRVVAEAAARGIALTPGVPIAASDVGPVRPTAGELRDIQRKSRMASSGQVTISRILARNVALGRITLDEAVKRQTGKA